MLREAVATVILICLTALLSGCAGPQLVQEDPDATQMKEQNYQSITRAIAQRQDINPLLDKQPALAKKTFAGKTLLFDAAFFGNSAAVKALLNHGADVTVRTALGETPLDRAISSKDAATIELLKSHGAPQGISKQ